VIDTSVLVAGVAGFKSLRAVENPSASLLRDWLEDGTFTWLVTEDIVSEYRGVLTRLGVRRNLVGEIINLLREEAEFVDVRGQSDLSPDPNDNSFCACAEQGRAAFIARSERQLILRMCRARARRVHRYPKPKRLPPKEVGCQSDLAG